MLQTKLIAIETAVLMATRQESQGLFEENKVEVHYSGLGKVNAAIKTMQLIGEGKYKNILNLGTAGSFSIPFLALVECREFLQRDMDLSLAGFDVGVTPGDRESMGLKLNPITDLPKVVCGTGDRIDKAETLVPCDIMDMEGYAIAKCCQRYGVNFYKSVSIHKGSVVEELYHCRFGA